jgi:hypothetical protein
MVRGGGSTSQMTLSQALEDVRGTTLKQRAQGLNCNLPSCLYRLQTNNPSLEAHL